MAQAYRWTLDDISKLTYPQVIMLQHAASYNRKLLDRRLASKRAEGTLSPTESLADTPMYNGKRFDELTSDEIVAMADPESRGPKFIKTKKSEPSEDEQE